MPQGQRFAGFLMGLLLALGQMACHRPSANQEAFSTPENAASLKLDYVAEVRADPTPSDPLPDGAVLRIGTARLRHNNHVESVAFSPDGKLLASGSEDHVVRLWVAATGKEVHCLKGHSDAVACVAFSPDGETLASAGGKVFPNAEQDDNAIHLWDVKTGKPRRRLEGHAFRVNCLAFSPDRRTLASAGKDGVIRLWNVSRGTPIRVLPGHAKPILALAFSADGKQLASGGADRAVVLWDTATGKPLKQLPEFADMVTSVALSPDGKFLATGIWGETVQLWNVKTSTEVRRWKQGDKISSVAFSPDGKFLAAGGWANKVQVWEVATGRERHRFEPKHGQILSLAFSPDGKVLAAGTAAGSIDRWDMATGKEIPRCGRHSDTVEAVAYAPDGSMLATASRDNTVRLWKADSGEPIGHIKPDLDGTGILHSLVFSPDGTMLTANAVHTAFLFHTWRVAQEPVQPGRPIFRCQGRSLAFLSKDKLANVQEGWVRILRLPDGREERQIKVTEFLSQCLAVSPNGKLVATGGYNRQIELRDMASGKLIRNFAREEDSDFGSVNALCFSPDGQTLASAAGGGEVRLWDARGDSNRRLKGHRDEVQCVAYSPDGKVLASGGYDGTVRLWSPANGQQIHQFSGHTASVTWLAFSPDGKRLASASRDTTVLIWDMSAIPAANK